MCPICRVPMCLRVPVYQTVCLRVCHFCRTSVVWVFVSLPCVFLRLYVLCVMSVTCDLHLLCLCCLSCVPVRVSACTGLCCVCVCVCGPGLLPLGPFWAAGGTSVLLTLALPTTFRGCVPGGCVLG